MSNAPNDLAAARNCRFQSSIDNRQSTIPGPGDSSELTPLNSTSLSADPVAQRILLAPWGQVESTNGTFFVDAESAACAMRAFDEHGTDLPIDYEHQTLGGSYASPTGQAPAAGWIKRLDVQQGVGLFAHIEWTDQAKQMLAAKEYRYLSPVAIVRKSDRKLVAIHSAALTNKPAIVGMTPIVNRNPLAATDAEPVIALREELDLPAEADVYELLLAAGERLAELRTEAKQKRVQAGGAAARRAVTRVAAPGGGPEALVAREEGLFDEWLRTAPVVLLPGRLPAPTAGDEASTRERAVALRARGEYRASRMLSAVTTETAYVAQALREAS